MADELVGFNLEGLKGTLAVMRQMNDGAARELRTQLRGGVATHFVNDVKAKIDERGLVKTGALRGSIKPSVRGSDVYAVSSPALHPGKKDRRGYAPIYEFGNGGRRAYMEPVLQEWLTTGKLEDELSGFIEWLGKEWRS